MRGACLLSRHSEDVSIFFGRASVHCEGLLDYWFFIKNCQRRFVEQFGQKPAVETLHSTFSEEAYLIFSCCQLPFCEFPKNTTALYCRYDMQMYCTFVLFVNQHFPGYL
jgi:hypothetical protein